MKNVIPVVTIASLSLLSPILETSASAAPSTRSPVQIECGGGFKTFSATLDFAGWDPDSGLFTVKNGHLLHNFHTARLICTGHRIEEISCVGYLDEAPSTVIEVSISPSGSDTVATLESLKGEWPSVPFDLKCKLSQN